MSGFAELYKSMLSAHPAFDQAMGKRWQQMPADKVRQYVRRQLEEAGIPTSYRKCTFDTLDATQDPEAFRVARAYAEGEGYEGKSGLLLIGPPGCGKTSLAIAILRHWALVPL